MMKVKKKQQVNYHLVKMNVKQVILDLVIVIVNKKLQKIINSILKDIYKQIKIRNNRSFRKNIINSLKK